uniref:Coiled-coil domain-containing protein 102A n=1 Tax=Ditylenchus dipsaci TaxID=166011 RepID=A0A915DF48_9BILA
MSASPFSVSSQPLTTMSRNISIAANNLTTTSLQHRFDEEEEGDRDGDEDEQDIASHFLNQYREIPDELAHHLIHNRCHQIGHLNLANTINLAAASANVSRSNLPTDTENASSRGSSNSQSIDWDLCEMVRIQELNENRQRASQMENTMRWWSQCTASWREKWNNVRNERNRARDDANRLRLALQEAREEIERLHLAREQSDSEARTLARRCRRQLNSLDAYTATKIILPNMIAQAVNSPSQKKDMVCQTPSEWVAIKRSTASLTKLAHHINAITENTDKLSEQTTQHIKDTDHSPPKPQRIEISYSNSFYPKIQRRNSST